MLYSNYITFIYTEPLPRSYFFNTSIRSTKEFYEDSTFTPARPSSTGQRLNHTVLGCKKCFIASIRSDECWVSMETISSRLRIRDYISFNLHFFECTDFSQMSRNCQNLACFVTTPGTNVHQLACVVYLPPCASYIYYLEWKGLCKNDLPDFVTFDSSTPPSQILKSFTFKKSPLSSETTITFVQMVLGPFSDHTYVCHYNHFDKCLELLPDGPSKLFPNTMWMSDIIAKLIHRSRSDNKKCILAIDTSHEASRHDRLHSLPSLSDIFQVVKKRSNTGSNPYFLKGKVVKTTLPVMNVHVKVSDDSRLSETFRNMFAIPFLGSKLGTFGNVDYETIKNIHHHFQNGISVSRHNSILDSVCKSVVEYKICDNNSSPMILTFSPTPSASRSVNVSRKSYGTVMTECQSSSRVIQCFVFYCQYCHPMLLSSSHKSFLGKAVRAGSGNRSCSLVPPGITNLYYGPRSNPTLAQASPVVGNKMCSHHDNYRSSWNAPMLASFLHVSNSLTSSIHHISRWTNPIIEALCCSGSNQIGKTLENWQLCRTTIITFSDNSKYLGFLNTSHIDRKDRYFQSVQRDLDAYVARNSDGEQNKFLSNNLLVGIGKPTTCSYQFLNYKGPDIDGVLFQFFLYDGFQVALRLHDFATKTFYGHMASHRTAMPVIVRNDKVYYNNQDISVFAWGKS